MCVYAVRGSRVRPNAEIGVFQPNQEVPVTPGPESKALSSSRKNKCRLAATGVTGFVCLKVNDLVAFRFRKFWTRRSPEPRVEEVIIRPVLTICSFQKTHGPRAHGGTVSNMFECARPFIAFTPGGCVCVGMKEKDCREDPPPLRARKTSSFPSTGCGAALLGLHDLGGLEGGSAWH